MIFSVSCEKMPDLDDHGEDFKVLVIGNSYGLDAFSYVPFILEKSCPGLNVRIWLLYRGSCDVGRHRDYIASGSKEYTLYYYETDNGTWQSKSNYSSRSAVRDSKWDLIVTHQVSSRASDYYSMADDLKEFVSIVKSFSNAEISWMQVPKLPTYNKHYYEGFYDAICWACDMVVENTDISSVIPCGTAVESARQTDMVKLGDYGELMHDGVHLQEGIPCLLEAYTAAQFLLDRFKPGKTIETCNLDITDGWINAVGIPGVNGNVVGTSKENDSRSKQMAMDAIHFPYKLMPAE